MTRHLFLGAPLAKLGSWASRHTQMIHVIGVSSVLISVIYLLARLLFTAEGSNPIAFWTLFAAEVFSVITLSLFLYDSWSLPPTETLPPLKVSTDIAIATYNEDISILEPTIVSSLRVRGVRTVWVLDDGKRDEVRALCDVLGARYIARPLNNHAKAGNINHALPMMDAELLLFLDADHVPARDIILKMSGYFADPRVAIVQSPHGFRNRDSSQHRDPSRHEQSLFYEVLMPAREGAQAAFWSGSAAIIRRSALLAVGGVATETIAEDLHTTLKIQRAGWRVRYHNEVMVSALAPHTTADYLLQRDRWARGTLAVMVSPESPVFGRGWRLQQRVHYLNNLLYYFIPFQRLAYVAVLLMVFLFGWLPLGSIGLGVMGLLLLTVGSNALTSVLFARGKRDAFDGTQYTWLSSAIHLKALVDLVRGKRTPFLVTPKVATQLSFGEKVAVLRLPISVTALLLVAWIYGSLAVLGIISQVPMLGQWAPGITDPIAYAWATFFLFLELGSLLRLLIREFSRTQLRRLWRFSTRMPALIDGHPVTVTDIHESGAAFESPEVLCEVGTKAEFVFSPARKMIRHSSFHKPSVHGTFTPVRIVSLPDRVVTAGTLVWHSDEDRWEAQDVLYSQLALREEVNTRGVAASSFS